MIVHVYSGLMSRCFTLVQAYDLTKKYGGKLVVIWPLEWACHIHYNEVFAPEQFSDIDMEVIEVDDPEMFHDLKGMLLKADLKGICSELAFRRKMKRLTAGTVRIEYNPDEQTGWSGPAFHTYLENRWHETKEMLERGEGDKIYAHAFDALMYGPGGSVGEYDCSCIKFAKKFTDAADAVLGEYKGRCTGLHIRRTDHLVAAEHSSTEGFIKAIDKELAADPEMRFFLSTDSEEEQRGLMDRYPGRIIIQQNKAWGRDNSTAMESGIIDMLCLSECRSIYGSYTSNFSRFASCYGQIGLTIVGE